MKKLYYIIGIVVILLTGYFIYQQAKAELYDTGLVGWWRMDTNDDSNGVTLDRSGNGNNGNLINIASSTFYSIGKIGQGFNFDGTNDYVDLGNPASLQITGAITFGAWVRFDSNFTIDDIIAKEGGTSDRGYRLVKEADTKPTCNVATNATTKFIVNSNTIMATSTWYHLVCVFTPSVSMAIFINGVQDAINTTSPPASQRNATVGPDIGTRNGAANQTMNGIIDDVRIYNRALSAAEVAQLYNMGQTQFHSFGDF